MIWFSISITSHFVTAVTKHMTHRHNQNTHTNVSENPSTNVCIGSKFFLFYFVDLLVTISAFC